MRCVMAGPTLRALGLAGRPIDLLSVDVEGVEPDVLRCFPFGEFQPRAVLVETNHPHKEAMHLPTGSITFAGVQDMRSVDRFFHRHGYSNRETFTDRDKEGRQNWVDNVFVRNERLVTPPENANALNCTKGARYRGRWCQPWARWEPVGDERWGECEVSARRK